MNPVDLRIRPARTTDVPAIYANIEGWAQQGMMLVRSVPNLFENLRDFLVAERVHADGTATFVGNAALHVLWGDIAEIRALAVVEGTQARGVGRTLVEACEAEARRLGIPNVFAWTYTVPFFEKCGYTLIDKSRELHPRLWSECLRCPFFVGCNENGMMKRLDGVPMPVGLPEPPAAQIPPGIS